jgi:hypothetical protein
MTRKPRSDNSLTTLNADQRERLTQWLFEENVACKVAVQRCKQEFGIVVSRKTLRKFYYQEQQNRALERIARCAKNANSVVKELTERPADTYRALIGMAGQIAFEKAFDAGGELDKRTICEFTRLLMEARKDDRECQRLALDREKWQFDAAEACQAELPELKAISGNPALSQKEKLRQIRLRLFGVAPK